VRRWWNGIVVVVGLVPGLPAVALAERLRPGSGRRVACLVVRAICRACGVRIEAATVDSATAVEDAVLVANHQSLLDPPALLVALDRVGVEARFVATAGLFRIPLLGGALRAIGTVSLDRQHPVIARQQLAALAATRPGPVVVFPQGAVPHPGEDLPFKKGAFALAVELGVPVVPVAIEGTGRLLPRGRRVTVAPGTVRIRLLEPIATDGVHRRVLRDRAEAAVRTALAR
jgi:1-acyl-sn-glycerol-3-phosphate acyltransferase